MQHVQTVLHKLHGTEKNDEAMSSNQCFSQCGPYTSSINITCEFVRDADSKPHTRPTKLETLRIGSISMI